MKFKMLIAVLIVMFSLNVSADRIHGGDMPFPIGKVTRFPMDKVKGVWTTDKLKQKLFRLKPLKGVLPAETIEISMLNFQRQVVAAGLGNVDADQILRARLNYIYDKSVMFITMANYCEDEGFEEQVDKSKCVKSTLVVSIDERPEDGKNLPTAHFVLKKTR